MMPLRALRVFCLILLCLLGAVAAVNTFSQAEFRGEDITFTTRLKFFVPGETRLSVPPIGVASAGTHRAPVRIQLELREINPSILKHLGGGQAAQEKLLAKTTVELRQATLRTAVLAVLLGACGSLGAAYLMRRTRKAHLIGAFLLGALFCLAMLGGVYLQFDPEALSQPTYEGMLESAPWVMSVLSGSFDGLHRLSEGFEVMARNLPRLSDGAQAGAPMSGVGEDLRVLHVSDIHNNRASLTLIGSLIESFAVDVVIDTGDLTDYGTSFESGIIDDLNELPVPYVFVPGNHDSPEIIRRLSLLPRVKVVGRDVIIVNGLRIMGIPDASAMNVEPAVPTEQILAAQAEELGSRWEEATVRPDLVAVHNPKVITTLIGRAPVILHGHTHRAERKTIDGTFVEDAGTSGAAGLRGLANEEGIPYTVSLQYWRRNPSGGFSLAAVDAISLDGLNGRLQVVRTTIDPAAPPSAGPD